MKNNPVVGGEAELRVLVSQVAVGDARAFNQLYRRTHAKMLRVALLVLRDRHAAEDAVQEGYLSVWRRASSYRPMSGYSPISWMSAIVKNKAIDGYRARRPSDESVSDDVRDLALDPEEATIRSQRDRGVAALLGRLDDKIRPAILGAYVEGVPYEALARRLTMPLNTLRTRLRRGLLELGEMARQAAP